MKRLIADYLIREGHLLTAKKLIEVYKIEVIIFYYNKLKYITLI